MLLQFEFFWTVYNEIAKCSCDWKKLQRTQGCNIKHSECLETRKELGSIYHQDLTFLYFYWTVKVYWDRNIFKKINSLGNPVSTLGCKSIPEYTAAQTIITCICMCLTCRLSAWKVECHPAAEWVVHVIKGRKIFLGVPPLSVPSPSVTPPSPSLLHILFELSQGAMCILRSSAFRGVCGYLSTRVLHMKIQYYWWYCLSLF